MAIWNRITALVTGGAVATAAADAMAPEFEVLKQTAWSNEPHKVLDPNTAAHLRAREPVNGTPGIGLEGVDLANDAARSGVGSHRFDLLTELARTEPGFGELLQLRRRNIDTGGQEGVSAEEFALALRRSGYTEGHIQSLSDLVADRLSPQAVALAVVRSLMDSGGLLTGENDTTGGKIDPTPTSPIDPVAEAANAGIDRERLRVMINSIGLPMALQAAANAVFRGIIDKPDFYLAVAQGDTRPAWADAIFEQARQILTAAQYVEGHLRGWITEPEMYAGTAKHGMSQADTDLLFKVSGRPITLHQITTGLARGGTYPSTYDDVPEPYRKSLEEGNIRPEWAALDYANRYSYPSGFQIRSEAQAGNLTEDETREVLLEVGWSPHWADHFAASWTKAAPAKAPSLTPAVKSAQGRFITAIHKAYVGGAITHDQMVLELQLSELSPADQAGVADFFGKERDLNQLPPPPAPVP